MVIFLGIKSRNFLFPKTPLLLTTITDAAIHTQLSQHMAYLTPISISCVSQNCNSLELCLNPVAEWTMTFRNP